MTTKDNNSKIFEEDVVDSTRNKIVLYGGATFERMFVPATDGLKPVNRRILYLLWEDKVHAHEKMATLAGAVLKYHPHGDSSVSDAMSKMGQWFYMNYPLIDPQGNYGTLDGDPPSAPRYIEAKPSDFARDVLLDEVDGQCIDYQDNYDFKRKEPVNLPAKLPLALVEGSEGIAVAFASSIPPHNLADVIDRTIRYIKNKNIDNEELVDGLYPDFPTGGQIMNGLEIKANYTKGVPCTIRIRSKVKIDMENSTIIVEELPFGVSFDKITEAIVNNRKEKKEESPFVDYLRVTPNNRNHTWEIEFKKGTNLNQILLDLLAMTPLETSRTLSFIFNDNGRPKQMNVKEVISKWYTFRVVVKKRKLTFEMNTLQNRTHVLEGILKCHANMDGVIKTIRESTSREDTISALVKKFDISMVQARGIVDMSLGSLSRYSKDDLINTIESNKRRLEAIGVDFTRIDEIIVAELEEIKKKYSRPRRTIINLEMGNSKKGVTHGSMVVKNGLVAWTDNELGMFDQEFLLHGKKITNGLAKGTVVRGAYPINENTKGFIVFYTDGTASRVQPGDLRSLHNWVKVTGKGYTIDCVVPVADNPDEAIVCLSDDYKIRQIKADDFSSRQISVGGRVVSAGLTRSQKDMILLLTESGSYLYFDKTDVPEFSRTASGVKTSFDKASGKTKVLIMNSQSPSALFSFGMSDDSGDQGYIFFVSPSKFIVGKRMNQPKTITAGSEHIRFISGTILIPKKDQKTELIMVGSTDMTSISSKFIVESGIPRRVPIIPVGSIIYEL